MLLGTARDVWKSKKDSDVQESVREEKYNLLREEKLRLELRLEAVLRDNEWLKKELDYWRYDIRHSEKSESHIAIRDSQVDVRGDITGGNKEVGGSTHSAGSDIAAKKE